VNLVKRPAAPPAWPRSRPGSRRRRNGPRERAFRFTVDPLAALERPGGEPEGLLGVKTVVIEGVQ
jgi:hypothetical protein